MRSKKANSKGITFTAAEWFGFLFTTFAIILFVVALLLNQSYYRTSLKSLNADLLEDFRDVAEGLKSDIKAHEAEILQMGPKLNSPPDVDDSFIIPLTILSTKETEDPKYDPLSPVNLSDISRMITSNRFSDAALLIESLYVKRPPQPDSELPNADGRMIVPVFMESRFTSFGDDDRCLDAFIQGLNALENGNRSVAEKQFKVSAGISPDTKTKRTVSAWSQAYILPRKKSEALNSLYYLLYILYDAPGGPLDEYAVEYAVDMLKGRFSDFEIYKNKSRDVWTLAETLTNQTETESLPIRTVVNGMIVSSVENGTIYAFKIDWGKHLPNTPSIRLKKMRPDELDMMIEFPLDFLPGYVLSVSENTFDVRTRAIKRQYLVTNTLLGLLLLLIVLFALGSVRLIREEKDLARLRSRFVATVSHELRTPLSLIQLYSETLNEGRIDLAKRRGYLQTIVAETQRLTGLVNNVIDFSRLEIGTKKLNYSDSNISELAWNVIQEFKYRLNLEGFRINVHIHPDLKARIDPQAFCRVLFNLLDNAIKYSEKEKYIALRLSKQDDKAVLEVTDHGIGIPLAARPFVFMDYYRVDDPRVASQRGSGIGLSVVKQLLDVMNASVQIQDASPAGTTFIVTIPTNRVEDRENKEK